MVHQILSTISTEIRIPSSSIIAAARDRAFINEVAVTLLVLCMVQLLLVASHAHWTMQGSMLAS